MVGLTDAADLGEVARAPRAQISKIFQMGASKSTPPQQLLLQFTTCHLVLESAPAPSMITTSVL